MEQTIFFSSDEEEEKEDEDDMEMLYLGNYESAQVEKEEQLHIPLEYCPDINKRSQYALLVKETLDDFFLLAKNREREWELIPPPPSIPGRVKLYRRRPVPGDPRHLLRVECESVRAPASRIIHLNVDNDFETRSQWDDKELIAVEQLESHRCAEQGIINYMRTAIRIPVPGVWDREFLGIQWVGYNRDNRAHVAIFRSVANENFPANTKNFVTGDALTGVWVKEDAHDDELCHLVMLAYVHPRGWLPSWLPSMFYEQFRNRVYRFEEVATRRWHKIYDHIENPPLNRRPPPGEK
jgi:START domain